MAAMEGSGDKRANGGLGAIQDRVLILGAAGRDYHLFNTKYRQSDGATTIVGFTHAQVATTSAFWHLQAAACLA